MKIIIANANVSQFLAQANEVLKKYGNNGYVPEKIKGQATLSSMKRFMEGDYLDVCAVRHMAKLNEVSVSTEHMDLFQSLHCVNWRDIHPDTREYVAALLVNYFKGSISMVHAEGTVA